MNTSKNSNSPKLKTSLDAGTLTQDLSVDALKRLTKHEAVALLENRVCFGSVDEVKTVLEHCHGKLVFTARALALACRYGGLEKVKILVEDGGCDFFFKLSRQDYRYYDISFDLGDYKIEADFKLFLVLDWLREHYVGYCGHLDSFGNTEVSGCTVLSQSERVEIIKFLFEEEGILDLEECNDLFTHAIAFESFQIAAELKKMGASFSYPSSSVLYDDDEPYSAHMREIIFMENTNAALELAKYTILVGKRLLITSDDLVEGFYNKPQDLAKLLEVSDITYDALEGLADYAISSDSCDMLTAILESGHLDNEEIIERVIKITQEHSKPEITAKLLDYKNSHADEIKNHKFDI